MTGATQRFLEILSVMPAAFVMCLVLTGIHGYLGLHVLTRKVIFVDLALAQIAALGGIVAMGLGYDMHEEVGVHAEHTLRLFEWLGWHVAAPPDAVMIYLFSLTFALAGAAVFALTRMKHERVPQEAFIGISFATAVALALLILAHRGGGAEHVKNMLASDALMLASWSHVAKTAGLYAVVGTIHVVFRRKFFRISFDPEAAMAEGMRVRWWDFVFYATFGFVITSSVAIAGVLLVFSYLVVPGAIAVMFADRVAVRVTLAWATGFLASVLGMLACAWDNVEPPGSPPGPWIVACFAGMLLLAGLVRKWISDTRRARTAASVLAGCAVVGVFLAGMVSMEKRTTHEHAGDPILEALRGGLAESLRAIDRIEELGDPHYVPALADLLLHDPSDAVVEHAVKTVASFGDRTALPALLHTTERDLDPGLLTEVARAVATLGDPRAIGILVQTLRGDTPPFLLDEAASLLASITGHAIDPADPATVDAVEAWAREHEATLHWDPVRERFEP